MSTNPPEIRLEFEQCSESTPVNNLPLRLNDVRNQIQKAIQKDGFGQLFFPQQQLLECEAELLYQHFIKNKNNHTLLKEQAVLEVLYFNCLLMQHHYRHYQHLEKQAHFEKIEKDLLDHAKMHSLEQFNRLNELKQKTEEEPQCLTKLETTYLRATVLRNSINTANMGRIYLIFCHFAVTETMAIASRSPLLAPLHISSTAQGGAQLNKALNQTAYVSNPLSVAFYGVHFLIDLWYILRHTFGRNKVEQSSKRSDRFWHELNKRKWDLLNNLVWGSVNFITNYSQVSGLPTPLIMPLISVLLVFDLVMVQLKRRQTYKTYLKNKDYIENKIAMLGDPPDPHKLALLTAQQVLLADKWDSSRQTYNFLTKAAFIIFASFSASLMFTAPVAILACYIVGISAIAMYFSMHQHGKYIAASKELSKAYQACEAGNQISSHELARLKNAVSEARNQLIISISEKTMIPSLILLCWAACWPLALSMTLLYSGIKISNHILEKKKNTASKGKDPELPLVKAVKGEEGEEGNKERTDEGIDGFHPNPKPS